MRALRLAACGASLALVGCNLHLDATLLDDAGPLPADDGGADGATDAPPDTSVDAASDVASDAASETSDGALDGPADAPHDAAGDTAHDAPVDAPFDGVDGGGCANDLACAGPGGCIEGRCDQATHACVYAVCPSQSACEARTCDTVQSTCNPAASYGFHAGAVDAAVALACGGALDACFATVGRFAFLGTTSGLLAWDLAAASAPTPAAVSGPSFAISRIVASGKRLLLVGPFSGGSGVLGWLDVPDDVVAPTLAVDASHTAFVSFGSAGVDAAYPATAGSFFLVRADAASNDPVGLVTPPLTNGDAVAAVPSTETTGLRVIGASGARVLLGSPASSSFAFVTGAGVAGSSHATTPTTPVPALPGVTAPFGFAFGADGTVLWSTRLAPSGVATAGLVWLVDGTSDFFQGTYALLSTYASPPGGTRLAGQSTLVTPSASGTATAVATSALPADLTRTVVRLVTYDGQRTNVPASPSYTLAAPPSAVVLRTAGNLAVAASPSNVVGHVALDVFDPACP